MSILTDEEIHESYKAMRGDVQPRYIEIYRDAERAVLAKLAGMELPEPVGAYEEVVGHEEWQGCPSELIEMRDAYSADQLRQAFAQGAVSQLSAEPVGEILGHDVKRFNTFSPVEYIEHGTKLYTLKEPK